MKELEAIRRKERCEWCSVRKHDRKSDLSKRIRDSIDRSVENGDLTYEGAMRDIRDEVLKVGHRTVEGKIYRIISDTSVTRSPIGKERKEEEWFSAQLYGALERGIRRNYEVYLEDELDRRSRVRADIYIEGQDDSGDFLVELKRSDNIGNGRKVERQLREYHQLISNRQKTFLCIIGGIDNLEKIEEIKSELSHVKIIINAF